MQAYKRKKTGIHRPVKSPSPDYCNANTSRKTSSPFRQHNQNQMALSPQGIRKSLVINKSAMRKISEVSETGKQASIPNEQISVAKRNASDENWMNRNKSYETGISRIYEKLQIVCTPFFAFDKHVSSKQMLEEIEHCIDNMIKRKYQAKSTQQIETLQSVDILDDSSISAKFPKRQQYQLENRRLRKELAVLKLSESSGYDMIAYSRIAKDKQGQITRLCCEPDNKSECDRVTHNDFRMGQFFVSKVAYLESELENKIVKLSSLEQEKNMEISRLKEKLERMNKMIENQMKSYNTVIHQQKQQIAQMQRQLMGFQQETTNMKISDPLELGTALVLSLDSQEVSRIRQSPVLKAKKNFEECDFKQCFSQEEVNSEMSRRRLQEFRPARGSVARKQLIETLVENLREIREEVEQAISIDSKYHQSHQQSQLYKEINRLQSRNSQLQQKFEARQLINSQACQLSKKHEQMPINANASSAGNSRLQTLNKIIRMQQEIKKQLRNK